MARFLASSLNKDALAFDELALARRYAHSLLKGTVVVITDLAPKPGRPVSYTVRARTKN